MGNKDNYPNHLGLLGWLSGGRWGIERYLYSLHRITGLGLIFYFLLHIFVTSARAFGGQALWKSLMGTLDSPIFLVGEFLVYVAFAFHAVNGIRLILIELGILVGRAEEPVYPYQSSIHVQRPIVFLMLSVVFVIILIGGYSFFFSH